MTEAALEQTTCWGQLSSTFDHICLEKTMHLLMTQCLRWRTPPARHHWPRWKLWMRTFMVVLRATTVVMAPNQFSPQFSPQPWLPPDLPPTTNTPLPALPKEALTAWEAAWLQPRSGLAGPVQADPLPQPWGALSSTMRPSPLQGHLSNVWEKIKIIIFV